MYKIQVGAFRLKLNAEKQAAKIIEQLGIKTAIVKEDGYYKVQCGAFSNVANALNRKILLENAGYKVITKTIQDSKEKSEDSEVTYTIEETNGTVNSYGEQIRHVVKRG